jgi:hypothetical protein
LERKIILRGGEREHSFDFSSLGVGIYVPKFNCGCKYTD